jgi:undecaprenyl pyrophosphate phosphatase UppP
MTSPFLGMFMVGAALLALWIDARFPNLAPASFPTRFIAAVVAAFLLHISPLSHASTGAAYASLFGAMLPAFVGAFLTAAWLMRALRDAHAS